MARVPYTGIPDAGISPAGPPGNVQNIQSSPSEFGAQVGAAQEKFGQNLLAAGNMLGQEAVQYQDLYNQVAVQEARNQQESIYHNIAFGDSKVKGDVGIYGLYGRAAMDAGPKAMEKLDATRASIRDGLNNDAQRLAFDRESHRYQTIIADSIGRHVDQQAHAWAQDVNRASTATAVQSAGSYYNDNASFERSWHTGMEGVVKGLQASGNASDPDITKNAMTQMASKLIVARAEEWSTRGNPIEALNWVQNGVLPDGRKVQDALEPNVVGTFQRTLQERVDHYKVNGFANSYLQNPGGGRPQMAATDLPPEAARVLPAIASGEAPAYDVRYTPGGGAKFSGFAQHPNIPEPGPEGPSTAAGLYQFTKTTWDMAAKALGLTDFSPESQDRAAWWNAQRVYAANSGGRNLQADIAQGGHEAEIGTALKNEWTSLRSSKGMNTFVSMLQGGGGAALTTRNPDVFAAEQSMIEDARKRAEQTFPGRPDLQSAAVAKVNQQIEQTNVRQRQYDAAVEKQRKDGSLQAESEYVPMIITDPSKVDVAKLTSDPRLLADPAKMTHLYSMLKTQLAGQTEKVAAVSHQTTVGLIDSMRRPEGDPARISDLGPAYKAYADGYMTNSDLEFVVKQHKEMQTPDGQRLDQVQQKFFQSVRSSIDKSNPVMGSLDMTGGSEFFRLQQETAAKIAAYRKAGKDPFDLFDPSKPDYLGKPETLSAYQKSIAETMEDYRLRNAITGARTSISNSGPSPPPQPPGPGFFGRLFGGGSAPAPRPSLDDIFKVPSAPPAVPVPQ